jgi:integrase/recombinase XerD
MAKFLRENNAACHKGGIKSFPKFFIYSKIGCSESSKLDQILMSLARIEKALKIIPDKDAIITDYNLSLENYKIFAREKLSLEETTLENQKSVIMSFLRHSSGRINKETIKAYLDSNNSAAWKSNHLKALRRYVRDFLKLGNWIEEFQFAKASYKPKKDLPTDKQLALFCNELPYQERLVFLLLYNSGLRIGEILSLKLSNLDFEQNMIDATYIHKGKTKSSWYSFFTAKAAVLLQTYLDENGLSDANDKIFTTSTRKVQQAFKVASKKLGFEIYPHLLRTVFSEKCRKAGIQEDYIDAFCGRTPKSVLARHYTNYSPTTLRKEYEKLEPFLRFE